MRETKEGFRYACHVDVIVSDILYFLIQMSVVEWKETGGCPPVKFLPPPPVAPKKFKIRPSLARIFRKLALH